MSGGFSSFLEDKTLEHIFITPYTPGTLSVGLCTADPTNIGTGAACNELPHTGGYERVSTETSDWILSESYGVTGVLYNKNAVEYPLPTNDWGLVTHFAILDSTVYGEGNMLISGLLASPTTIVDGSIPRFSPYAMVLLLV